mgnify:CR=1 FL=1
MEAILDVFGVDLRLLGVLKGLLELIAISFRLFLLGAGLGLAGRLLDDVQEGLLLFLNLFLTR